MLRGDGALPVGGAGLAALDAVDDIKIGEGRGQHRIRIRAAPLVSFKFVATRTVASAMASSPPETELTA